MSRRHNHVKEIALVASMGALGNVLALFSMYLAPIHPQVALDLSHLATAVAAFHLGPVLGTLTGALVSFVPFYRFGVTGWYGPILGSLIIPGKALTGLGFGIAMKRIRPFPAALLGFIPEFIYTFTFLKYVTIFFIPALATYMTDAVIITILSKAWVEMGIIGFVMEVVKKRKILTNL